MPSDEYYLVYKMNNQNFYFEGEVTFLNTIILRIKKLLLNTNQINTAIPKGK